jgi:hypothetical protein
MARLDDTKAGGQSREGRRALRGRLIKGDADGNGRKRGRARA